MEANAEGYNNSRTSSISFVPFENESYLNAKEESQRGDLYSKDSECNISTGVETNDFDLIKKFSFISLNKKIGQHKGIAKKIRELKDGLFVSDGQNEIIKYDKNFNQEKIEFKKEYYYSFFPCKNEVIISLNTRLTSLSKPSTIISLIQHCRNLFELKSGNYIICTDNGIYYCSDILNHNLTNNNCYIIDKKAYRGGIKINYDLIAITSNHILSNGENKLIFYSSNSQKFLKEIEIKDFSFTISENNCSIMGIPEHENSKLLLAACKKYSKGDNGILLIILQFNKENNDIKRYFKFYDTKNFEVYCFCPIFVKGNKENKEIKNKKIENDEIENNEIKNEKIFIFEDYVQKYETEYFLVGGFDLNKNEGLIKLYKVIYFDEIEKTEIKYIQDIILEKNKGKYDLECFKGFKGPISCIIQSSETEILVTCYDGNVYLFSQPCLECLKSCKENYDKDFAIQEL